MYIISGGNAYRWIGLIGRLDRGAFSDSNTTKIQLMECRSSDMLMEGSFFNGQIYWLSHHLLVASAPAHAQRIFEHIHWPVHLGGPAPAGKRSAARPITSHCYEMFSSMLALVIDRAFALCILISLGVAALTVGLYRQARSRGHDARIPSPPRDYPILGHMLQFLRPDYHRLLLSFADELGPVFRVK